MRILTFSDIHYKEGDKNKPSVKKFFTSFKSKIIELNDEIAIDLVVISGDLAYSGKTPDYLELKEVINDIIPNSIPTLYIVGNHDVNWTNLKDALGRKIELPNLFDVDEEKFSQQKFIEIFSNFNVLTNSVEKNILSRNGLNYKFCNKTYTGILHSKSDNILILLLNSSFYSFGPGVIKDYFEIWADKKDIKRLIDEIPSLLGEKLSQEGKQSYFLNSYPYFEEANKLITENENLKVITFAHHPPSCLKWDELYSEDDTKRNFNTLIELSDIIITGHSHNPVSEPSLIQNRCYHINNGVFLDYHYIEKDVAKDNPISVFPNNWFSLIEIDGDNFKLMPYKFITKKNISSGRNFSCEWIIIENISTIEYKIKSKNNKKTTSIDSSNKNDKIIESEFSPIYYTPKNTQDIISTIQKARRNNFISSDSTKKPINTVDSIHLKLNKEDYIIIINGLDDFYTEIKNAKTYTELKLFPKLASILKDIEIADISKLPIIAFYDILEKSDSINENLFEDFHQSKFVAFQSFKHYFFTKFEELFKFTEINIVYDIFFY